MQQMLSDVQRDSEIDRKEKLELARKRWEVESEQKLIEKDKEISQVLYQVMDLKKQLEASQNNLTSINQSFQHERNEKDQLTRKIQSSESNLTSAKQMLERERVEKEKLAKKLQ